jgi:hypothetical protein
MKFTAVEQYTDQWRRLRMGRPSASKFHLLITPEGKPRNPDTVERKRYLYKLVAERILKTPMPDSFEGNEHTERGHLLEARARSSLEKKLEQQISEGGFCLHDNLRYGCSPDGLLSNRREAVEIKAPAAWTHIQYICEGPGDKYKAQVQGHILIGEFDCCHFWSYHPDFAPVYICTLPDEKFIGALRKQLDLFFEEVLAKEEYVRRHGGNEWREVIMGGLGEKSQA